MKQVGGEEEKKKRKKFRQVLKVRFKKKEKVEFLNTK